MGDAMQLSCLRAPAMYISYAIEPRCPGRLAGASRTFSCRLIENQFCRILWVVCVAYFANAHCGAALLVCVRLRMSNCTPLLPLHA